jgi:hypothetical protein
LITVSAPTARVVPTRTIGVNERPGNGRERGYSNANIVCDERKEPEKMINGILRRALEPLTSATGKFSFHTPKHSPDGYEFDPDLAFIYRQDMGDVKSTRMVNWIEEVAPV